VSDSIVSKQAVEGTADILAELVVMIPSDMIPAVRAALALAWLEGSNDAMRLAREMVASVR